MITFTAISTALTSLFFLSSGISVYLSWRKHKSALLKFLAIFLISFGIQQMFFAIGSGPASSNPILSNWFWAIAHIFMFIGISYFLRFPMHLRFSKIEKPVFIATIIYSILGTIILFLSIPKIEPFLLENGIYNWKVLPVDGAVIGIFTTICLLFSFGIFIAEGRSVKERFLKLRAWFMASGILIFLIGGPIHNFIKTPLLNFIADFALIFGSLLMLMGIYINKFLQQRG